MRKYVFLVDWDVETPSPESVTIPEPPESRRISWGCEGQKKIRRLRSELQQDWKFLIRRDCGRNCNQRNVFYKSQQLRLSIWRISHEKHIYITSKKKTWDEFHFPNFFQNLREGEIKVHVLQADAPKLQDKYSFLKFRDSHHVQLNPEFLEFHLPSKSLFHVDWEFQTIRHAEFEGSPLTKLHSELQNWIYFRKIARRFSSFT